jgi:fumarate hydratase class I
MRNLKANLLELIRRTSAELPDDVFRAVDVGAKSELVGTTGAYAMDIITKNIDLASEVAATVPGHRQHPVLREGPGGFRPDGLRGRRQGLRLASNGQGYLRQNSVDSVTGKNSGNNLGPGSPTIHFHQYRGTRLDVRLVLKGGGCENVGAQYSLPDTQLGANRDLDGVRKVILDAVVQAQGKGCSPGILGVCIGGDRATGYLHSKEQLLRTLDDVSPDPPLAALERDIVQTANKLGIGPMGFGGKTTLLGCKIGALNRLPASFFVSISYMCGPTAVRVFAEREGKIVKWLY